MMSADKVYTEVRTAVRRTSLL